jgi:hypothetical protein
MGEGGGGGGSGVGESAEVIAHLLAKVDPGYAPRR